MQKGSKTKYSGLNADFRALSQNLCLKTLPLAAWYEWERRQFIFDEAVKKKVPFPDDGTGADKLHFLDRYLYHLLLPKNMAPLDRRMEPRIRADLNFYRGWLLHRVLRQVGDRHKYEESLQGPAGSKAYELPVDLPKVVDDLYLFFTHTGKRAQNLPASQRIPASESNLAKYPSLDALHKCVKPFQYAYPLFPEKRAMAFARYLETETPAELQKRLPENWRARQDRTIDPDNNHRARRGGAKLVATLEDGTELIHITQENASKALGSPRWCTAYREQPTEFRNYQDNLLIVLAPDGQRWQIHFRQNQIHDAKDNAKDFGELLRERPGLEEALKNYFRKNLNKAQQENDFESAAALMPFIRALPGLLTEVDSAYMQKLLNQIYQSGLYSSVRDILQVMSPNEALIPFEVKENYLHRALRDNSRAAFAITEALMGDPSWWIAAPLDSRAIVARQAAILAKKGEDSHVCEDIATALNVASDKMPSESVDSLCHALGQTLVSLDPNVGVKPMEAFLTTIPFVLKDKIAPYYEAAILRFSRNEAMVNYLYRVGTSVPAWNKVLDGYGKDWWESAGRIRQRGAAVSGDVQVLAKSRDLASWLKTASEDPVLSKAIEPVVSDLIIYLLDKDPDTPHELHRDIMPVIFSHPGWRGAIAAEPDRILKAAERGEHHVNHFLTIEDIEHIKQPTEVPGKPEKLPGQGASDTKPKP